LVGYREWADVLRERFVASSISAISCFVFWQSPSDKCSPNHPAEKSVCVSYPYAVKF
jgi:hypothetical protein